MAIGNITKQFQSTPPRRRRPGVNLDFFKKINFNPRLREGGDDFQTVIHSNFLRISIHASEKEATT